MIYEVTIPDSHMQKLLDAADEAEISPPDWIQEVVVSELEKKALLDS